MIGILQQEFAEIWHFSSLQFGQIYIYYAIGIILGSLISVFGKQKMLRLFTAMQSKKLGVLGVAPACVIGVASPLCLFGAIPVAASLSEKGVKDDLLAAFIMGSILLNPQLIVYSAALGTQAFAARVVSCCLCGVVAGLCVRFFYVNKGKGFFKFESFGEPVDSEANPNVLIRLLKSIWRNLNATSPHFFIGIALSAAFQRYVPENLLINLLGGDRALGVFMAATVGVPLDAYGGGTVPLLQGWLVGGMSIGTAAAFMIGGPSAKITNLCALKIVLSVRRFILYLLFAFLISIVARILIDILFIILNNMV